MLQGASEYEHGGSGGGLPKRYGRYSAMSNDSPSYLEIDRGVPPSQTDGGAAESGSVPREMAASYRRLVESYRQEWGLSAADSDARTREPHEPAWREAISKGAPESLLWWELSSVAEQNPDLMHTLWERAKREAVQELASGHRAAGAGVHGDALGPRPVLGYPRRLSG